MNAVELERIAATIVPPVGATGICLVTEDQQYRAAFVVNGRLKASVGPTFKRPREAARFAELLNGDVPAPRSAAVIPAAAPLSSGRKETGEPDQLLTGAPCQMDGGAPSPVTGRRTGSAPGPSRSSDSGRGVQELSRSGAPSRGSRRTTGHRPTLGRG